MAERREAKAVFALKTSEFVRQPLLVELQQFKIQTALEAFRSEMVAGLTWLGLLKSSLRTESTRRCGALHTNL